MSVVMHVRSEAPRKGARWHTLDVDGAGRRSLDQGLDQILQTCVTPSRHSTIHGCASSSGAI